MNREYIITCYNFLHWRCRTALNFANLEKSNVIRVHEFINNHIFFITMSVIIFTLSHLAHCTHVLFHQKTRPVKTYWDQTHRYCTRFITFYYLFRRYWLSVNCYCNREKVNQSNFELSPLFHAAGLQHGVANTFLYQPFYTAWRGYTLILRST